eukprot:CAMPEP_0195122686 /NCGR_PEP_ID=MMETSP0448-20130528/126988_1 /TAXON_ID=66468 /ORGANISM="Heterocapsa triquestra, Strain CCMP 448" /LENGTH=115 /DNA_ID=CAMNT_0040160189 /DNA_START=1 /DNA_END=345 /DNA_ORIENTATION=-
MDISAVVIEQMSKRHAALGQRFLQMDLTQMTFADNSFDVVFDKGTLDALYSGNQTAVVLGVEEIYRVLRPNGTLFSITMADAARRQDLKRSDWAWFKTLEIRQEPQAHYLHAMAK